MIQQNKSSFNPLKILPGIAWFLFVMVLVCLPGKDVPEPAWASMEGLDKLVHAGLFGGIVFWFCLPFKKAAMNQRQKLHLFIKITIAAIIWGITTEFIQKYFIVGRQFDLLDWAADSAGAVIAFFVSKKFFL